MSFLWPRYLWLLLAIPLLMGLYLWLLRRRNRNALRYASLGIVKAAIVPGMAWRRHVPAALLLLAVAGLLLASARPLAVVSLPSTQATIMLAIDVSLSMRATDVQPNRLVAAQEAAKAFLKDLPKNIKVGIVAFAGSAQVVQKATYDRESLVAAIDGFQMQRGTAVGSAIVLCLAELFPDHGLDLGELTFGSRPRGKSLDEARRPQQDFVPVVPGSYPSAAIILLTDGRRTTGIDTLDAAKLAADRGIRIYSVGLGTVDGEVPGFEGWSIYLKLDEPTLKEVARSTAGEYYYAGTAESLKAVYQTLGSRLQVETRETEVSALLAMAAALLMLVAAGLSLRWFGRVV